MSDNALTVIHWSRYDGTAQTRPHSVKDVYPLPRAGSVRSISNRRHFNCCPKKIMTRTPLTA